MLGHDTLEMIFTRLDQNAVLTASLTCTQISALRPAGARFQTDVLTMNQTAALFAWVARLDCPILQYVKDFVRRDSNANRVAALRKLCMLGPVVSAVHAGRQRHRVGAR